MTETTLLDRLPDTAFEVLSDEQAEADDKNGTAITPAPLIITASLTRLPDGQTNKDD